MICLQYNNKKLIKEISNNILAQITSLLYIFTLFNKPIKLSQHPLHSSPTFYIVYHQQRLSNNL